MLFNKINANGVIECELKTATKIITNKLSEQFDHKCTMTECNLCAALSRTHRCTVHA